MTKASITSALISRSRARHIRKFELVNTPLIVRDQASSAEMTASAEPIFPAAKIIAGLLQNVRTRQEPGQRRQSQARPSSPPLRPSPFPNMLVFGKPLGARRPASARLPRQSARSLSERLNIRPAESIQLRPFSTSKVLMSDKPPSL